MSNLENRCVVVCSLHRHQMQVINRGSNKQTGMSSLNVSVGWGARLGSAQPPSILKHMASLADPKGAEVQVEEL